MAAFGVDVEEQAVFLGSARVAGRSFAILI